MKALAIDTSNYSLGVSIVDEGKVIGEYITNIKKNHSVRAMPAIDQLLTDCDLKPKDLEKIIVAKGPGSYTGVRIGVTIAKTLAWSLNIPIVGISSLEVAAAAGRHFPGYICPFFDARRGQVYTGVYKYENDQLINIMEDQNVLLVDLLEQLKVLNESILFISSDIDIHWESIEKALGKQAVCPAITERNPRPSELALLGLDKEGENVHTLVPNYIRLAEAEVKWLERNK
ncbi:tRNA (adenosine(37)-N6)-threonylcarbamoyltransferase complex dimerization subunit type 1 TsaB [Metabacillus arenae]|uniref:tRNA (Adenosine(37)-N6)-threonylcarbamoyltransferase complex dimerization subunit type 1 TsaB n=1 Tax=Metabacillus arenae TaxID=2771434 RepID=A0A926NGR6_9BACI|nr:tRNA (adenosine(37)-N6)-threonylcarbamoyltransferase complex dimerization subunit type 1 TsaB [Metabacillus arenae]MBD1383159.1 tRNA (adenosine(37)-N6)-threonylcarbamoyltransferase complex dimerization subunit type 1 TsaB [Metabacillus arenae]